MDNPSVSRDPRRNRNVRPTLPSKLSQPEAQSSSRIQQPPAPVPQPDVPGDVFIQGIGDLVQTAVSAAIKAIERDKTQNQRDSSSELLNSAKKHYSSFPSLVEFHQQDQDQKSLDLANKDKEIKRYGTEYQRLMLDLKNKWAASLNVSSQSNETVSQLQKDLKAANEKISNLHRDIASLSRRESSYDKELESLRGGLASLQGLVSSHGQSFAEYTSPMSLIRRDLDAVSKELKERSVRTDDGLNADARKAIDDISLKVKNLEQRTTALTDKVGVVSSSYQRISELPDQVKRSLKEQEESRKDQEQSLKNHEKRLSSMANDQAVKSKLDFKIQSLEAKINAFFDLAKTKDDLHFAEIEETKQQLAGLDGLKQKMAEFQATQELLSNTMEDTILRTPREPLDAKVNALLADVQRYHSHQEKYHSQLEAINMALVSLESRYNNLSTEPIVTNMVGAMQEMYPSLQSLCNDLAAYKRTVDETLPVLQKKLGQLESQGSKTEFPQEELNGIKATQADLSRTIGDLLQKYQWLNHDEYLRLQASVESLTTMQKHTEDAFQQKQTADQENLHKIEQESELLSKRLTSLSDALERLDSDYHQTRSEAVNDQEELTTLRDRLATLEESATQERKDQYDNLEKAAQRSDSPSRQPPPRPDLVSGNLGMRIKRRHSQSGDERSPAPSNSPRSPDSTASPTVASGELRKKKKKKKKRRLESRISDQIPIQLDD